MPSLLQRGACTSRRARRVAPAALVCAGVAAFHGAPRDAAAQSPTWEIAGAVGAGFRGERGHTLGGARFEGALRRVPGPATARSLTVEFGAAIAQITAHDGPTGDGPNVKENSAELFVRAERLFLSGNTWRVDGSLAPVISVSMGCTAGGSFARDQAGYGDTRCTNDFAKKATVRPGASARITAAARGPRVSAIAGVDATVGTVAAGNTVGMNVFIGFRAPLSTP